MKTEISKMGKKGLLIQISHKTVFLHLNVY